MNPRNFSRRHSKGALSWIELYVVRTKDVEYFPEVFQVIFLPSTFYQHVVNVNLDISTNLLYEHFVHKPLIRRARIV